MWLWDAWPGRWGPDTGIDLVAQAKDDTLWAIQAKCYDPETTVTLDDMNKFFGASNRQFEYEGGIRRFSQRLLIATTNHVSKHARESSQWAEKPVALYLRWQLEECEWPVSFAEWQQGYFPERKRKPPAPHQETALKATLDRLETHDRGQKIMACGTGKTLTALWLHERLPSSCTLVLMPSLSLLGQTIKEWVSNAKTRFEWLPVCSDDTVRKDAYDANISSTMELGFPATTDPDKVRAFLEQKKTRVVFSTYHSSPVIADALAGTRLLFDLVIADEAHRCTGVKGSSPFLTVLDDKKIRARKRVFMTATPRNTTERLKREAEEKGLETASMDDETVFGSVCHTLTFGTAIEQKLLANYELYIIAIDDDRYRRYAEEGRVLRVGDVEHTDARTLATHVGLAKAMRDHDLRRVITFHNRVKGANAFAKAIPGVIEWMPAMERPSGKIWAASVSGEMPVSERMIQIDRLKAVDGDNRGILSNARCLGEGIDVPTLDAIAFVDPRWSRIDIVQAVGRAIRPKRSQDGRVLYQRISKILIPVFCKPSGKLEDAIDRSVFKMIGSV